MRFAERWGKGTPAAAQRVTVPGTETPPAPGKTTTPWLRGAGSLEGNCPKPRAKPERR